jgi:hypothetical protein
MLLDSSLLVLITGLLLNLQLSVVDLELVVHFVLLSFVELESQPLAVGLIGESLILMVDVPLDLLDILLGIGFG